MTQARSTSCARTQTGSGDKARNAILRDRAGNPCCLLEFAKDWLGGEAAVRACGEDPHACAVEGRGRTGSFTKPAASAARRRRPTRTKRRPLVRGSTLGSLVNPSRYFGPVDGEPRQLNAVDAVLDDQAETAASQRRGVPPRMADLDGKARESLHAALRFFSQLGTARQNSATTTISRRLRRPQRRIPSRFARLSASNQSGTACLGSRRARAHRRLPAAWRDRPATRDWHLAARNGAGRAGSTKRLRAPALRSASRDGAGKTAGGPIECEPSARSSARGGPASGPNGRARRRSPTGRSKPHTRNGCA